MNDGLILINKPKGMTSHDVVNRIRKLTGIKKVGHTGTLDPDAQGLLVIAIGKATKLIPYLETSNKEYEAEVIFGLKTDTDDIGGTVIETKEVGPFTRKEVKKVLETFIGEQEQIPPIYSAKKVNGKKLYEYARKGQQVEIKPSKITINNIELLGEQLPEKILINIDCSPGTYIRSLARDIGENLETYAVMGYLNRKESSGFKLADAVDLDKLDENTVLDHILPLEEVKLDLEKVDLSDQGRPYFENGNRVFGRNLLTNIDHLKPDEMVALYHHDQLVGIGQIVEEQGKIKVQPKRIL